MADQDWLRNLARASFARGGWVHPDPQAVRRQAEARIAGAVEALHETAEEYCAAFNELAGGRRSLRVLKAPSGFLLLLGRCQVSVDLQGSALVATLVTVQGFQRVPRPLHRFEAHADPFGAVAWRMDNALLMTGELIIKRLFEDITRAAYEAGEIPPGG